MEENNHDDAANYRMSSPIKRRFSLNEDGEVRKVALVTGVTGQDGSYLCEFLLDKVRRRRRKREEEEEEGIAGRLVEVTVAR